MDLRIHGLGGSYTPDRKPLPRKNARARPPHAPSKDALADRGVAGDSWLHEQSRAAVAAVAQAIQAAETASAIVCAAEAGLSEISQWLALMEKCAGEAVLGSVPADACQTGLDESRERIAALAGSVRFGELKLLDGGLGCTGMAFGEALAFVAASPRTRTSPPDGYPVWIARQPRRAEALAGLADLRAPPGQALRLAVEAGGKTASCEAAPGDSPADIARALQAAAAENGLEVSVACVAGNLLRVRHLRFGRANDLELHGSPPELLVPPPGRSRLVTPGRDVAGSINGEPALGEGRILTGRAGNRMTDGLSVWFHGTLPEGTGNPARPEALTRLGLEQGAEPEGHPVGRIIVAQQPLILRMGAGGRDTAAIRLDAMQPAQLGLGVENASGFRSLAQVELASSQEACDALLVTGHALAKVRATLAGLEELKGSVLAENLARLRVEAQNHQAFFTNIADAGVAWQAARHLRGQMENEAGLALVAQLRPLPGAILRLLAGETSQGTRPGRA